jgi:hypothetical protein
MQRYMKGKYQLPDKKAWGRIQSMDEWKKIIEFSKCALYKLEILNS